MDTTSWLLLVVLILFLFAVAVLIWGFRRIRPPKMATEKRDKKRKSWRSVSLILAIVILIGGSTALYGRFHSQYTAAEVIRLAGGDIGPYWQADYQGWGRWLVTYDYDEWFPRYWHFYERTGRLIRHTVPLTPAQIAEKNRRIEESGYERRFIPK